MTSAVKPCVAATDSAKHRNTHSLPKPGLQYTTPNPHLHHDEYNGHATTSISACRLPSTPIHIMALFTTLPYLLRHRHLDCGLPGQELPRHHPASTISSSQQPRPSTPTAFDKPACLPSNTLSTVTSSAKFSDPGHVSIQRLCK